MNQKQQHKFIQDQAQSRSDFCKLISLLEDINKKLDLIVADFQRPEQIKIPGDFVGTKKQKITNDESPQFIPTIHINESVDNIGTSDNESIRDISDNVSKLRMIQRNSRNGDQ